MSSTPTLKTLLICFYDIRGFTRLVDQTTTDLDTFVLLNEMARKAEQHVQSSGGEVVKFIGDAALIIYPEERIDDGVRALLELKTGLQQILLDHGKKADVLFALHVGEVAVGPFGTSGRTDVLGSAVNTTAQLEKTPCKSTFIISPQLFRRLSTGTRKLFHKFTPPVVYTA